MQFSRIAQKKFDVTSNFGKNFFSLSLFFRRYCLLLIDANFNTQSSQKQTFRRRFAKTNLVKNYIFLNSENLIIIKTLVTA